MFFMGRLTALSGLPVFIRTILLDVVLAIALFSVISLVMSSAIELGYTVGVIIVFVSVLLVIPITLLSCETLISKENDFEDASIVLRTLKKKAIRQKRTKQMFSAFGNR